MIVVSAPRPALASLQLPWVRGDMEAWPSTAQQQGARPPTWALCPGPAARSCPALVPPSGSCARPGRSQPLFGCLNLPWNTGWTLHHASIWQTRSGLCSHWSNYIGYRVLEHEFLYLFPTLHPFLRRIDAAPLKPRHWLTPAEDLAPILPCLASGESFTPVQSAKGNQQQPLELQSSEVPSHHLQSLTCHALISGTGPSSLCISVSFGVAHRHPLFSF